ncbi:hypothetical protein G7B40_004210 [Aetokthonos hydrillicola Thurmond2011]|uniref:Cytochrome c domain-containing protein n=1 Tax=Aetokthonos hydrillicola Thurmond2011 TaxID=2712845 RepID=A0AAP5M7J3_9CYAN|nr:hypothetical protein [Aetokthonos hydrillicola]MDR9893777.1 hypothetical protein [Aetokthonos hydrillicola Thurmond2011]
MKRISLILKGCLMLLTVIVCLICGYGVSTALASEYSQPVPIASEYDKTPTSESSDNCDGLGYLPYNSQLTEAENRGRCTWYLWTGGNDKYYREIAKRTDGNVDLLSLIDSRKRDERFKKFGTINDPGCEKATEPDKYGLWLDKCKDPLSTGVIGLRKFNNPDFDPKKWDPVKYSQNAKIEPPYRIGQTCAICHVALNPLNPPEDPAHPTWDNLVSALGNQYIKEAQLFSTKLKDDNFVKQVLNTQPPGTSDTSRVATDHINNPNAINSIFNLSDRPTYPEVMDDGSTKEVHHILKDGADSTGVANASLRVYVNIGMCGDYWLSLHDAMLGRKPQKPFDIETARKNCEYWRKTEARMADAEAFLKTIKPMYLKDAPGGEAFLTKDESVLKRGKIAFANTCASCHSSKQPPAEIAIDPEKAQQWYLESVFSSDFLDHNYLSDDKRYPVTLIGTNASRTLGTNATQGHIWGEFSSKTYKELPSPGELTLENPFNETKPIKFEVPSGGVGYYRTPTLVSIWATAPLLHNNSLGKYNEDPSVKGRIEAYTDAMEKLLWPEKRDKVIYRTTQDSTLGLPLGFKAKVPKGTPVNLVANIDPKDVIANINLKNVIEDLNPEGGLKGKLVRVLLRANKSPDFFEDKGHTFGSELSDEDKKGLIEFLKTF